MICRAGKVVGRVGYHYDSQRFNWAAMTRGIGERFHAAMELNLAIVAEAPDRPANIWASSFG